MKNVIKVMLLFTLLVPALLQAQELSQSIVFRERVYNFGTIQEKDGKVSHVFEFKNQSREVVEISDINSGCGCIGKVMTPGPIAPGATGKITIIFNPAYNEGFFSKEIVVLSKNNTEYNRIWVEGNIIPMLRPVTDEYPYSFSSNLYLRLKVLALGYMVPGQTKEMALHYANDSNEEMDLRFEMKAAGGWISYTNPGKIKPKEKGVMYIKYCLPWYSLSDEQAELVPVVNGKRLHETVVIKALNDLKPTPVPMRRGAN